MAIEDYKGDMEMCCRCSACKYIPLQMIKNERYSDCCPSIARYNFHAYSASGKLIIGREMLNKGFSFTEKFLHILYNCQTCGACDVSCKYAMDMEVLWPIIELRIKAVNEGYVQPALEAAVKRLRNEKTMIPGVKSKRASWADGLGLKDIKREKVDIYYHVGCLSSFDREYQKIAKAVTLLLTMADLSFGINHDEICCGGRAFQMGYKDDFLSVAKDNVQILKDAGVKMILTSCAECYYAFKVLYDKFGLTKHIKVLHTTELFIKLLNEGKIVPKRTLELNLTYHDPCHLGRLSEPWVHWEGRKIPGYKFVFDPPKPYRRGTYGVYEPPRKLLKSIPGVKLLEMDRIREYAFCCGAGGGVNISNHDFALWTAERRIEEALSTGAEAIVTACPWCEKNLKEASKKSNGIKVYDIIEVLEEAFLGGDYGN